MKQCFSWWCYANRGVEQGALLRGAKQIGYDGVELIDRSLWDAAKDAGLEVVTHNGHQSIESGLNDPANHDRIVREIEANLEDAAQYGVQKLIVFSGNRREGLSEEEGAAHTIKGLSRLAPLAEDAEVTLILELLNSKVDHRGYQCDSSVWARSVVEAVGSPRVKALYDIYHAQIMEGDLVRTIGRDSQWVGHYHTAGNPGRHDLDADQEIAYPAVFQAIAATGYDGYIGHEFLPKGDVLPALEAAFKLTQDSLAG